MENNKTQEKVTRDDQPQIQVYECPYMRKPKEKTSVWRKIYNPDKNYFFGRTPKNWGKLSKI